MRPPGSTTARWSRSAGDLTIELPRGIAASGQRLRQRRRGRRRRRRRRGGLLQDREPGLLVHRLQRASSTSITACCCRPTRPSPTASRSSTRSSTSPTRTPRPATDRVAEEFDDAGAIGGAVADALSPVLSRCSLRSPTRPVPRRPTSTRARAPPARRRSPVGPATPTSTTWRRPGSRSGAHVNQLTTTAAPDQDVVLDAFGARPRHDPRRARVGALASGASTTPGEVGAGGYFNTTFVDNYARAYIDDAALVIGRAGRRRSTSLVRSELLQRHVSGQRRRRGVAVDGAFGARRARPRVDGGDRRPGDRRRRPERRSATPRTRQWSSTRPVRLGSWHRHRGR